jgi:uncharacterized protein YegP (UPF0339 family)
VPKSLVDIYVWYSVKALDGERRAEERAKDLRRQLSSNQLKVAADRLSTVSARELRDQWHFYTDMRGAHRWRRIAPNGKFVSASEVGYRHRNAAMISAEKAGYKQTGHDKAHIRFGRNNHE